MGEERRGKNPGFCNVAFSSLELKTLFLDKLLAKGVEVFEREIKATAPDRVKRVDAFILVE